MPTIAKDDARKIAQRFVAQTYDPLIAKHAERADNLIEQVLVEHYGPVSLATFRDLPSLFWTTTHTIETRNDAGYRIRLRGNEAHRVPYGVTHDIILIGPTLLQKRVAEWGGEQSRLIEERDALVKQTTATILTAKTDTRLRETWPEIVPFLPAPKEPAKPVTIRTDDIMTALANARTPQ